MTLLGSPSQQELESHLQKRLSEVVGSVRYLSLSDLDYTPDDDDEIALKAADDDKPGRLIAQFSVAGIKDSYGDVITQDAFNDINGTNLAMVWSHKTDQIIGKGVVRLEGKKAIWDGQLFVGKSVPDADKAYTVIKELGRMQEYSWGFRIKEAKPIKEKGPDGQMIWMGGLEITKVAPIEVSPVLKGAHPKTKTISIKAEDVDAPQVDPSDTDASEPDATRAAADVVDAAQGMTVVQEFEAALAAASSFADRMKRLDATRMEERQRHLSDENLGRLKQLGDALAEVQSQIDTILTSAAPEVAVPIGDRFRFLDVQRAKLDLIEQTGD